MIKLTFCLVRLPRLSLADFQSYWRDHHAPLVRARADVLRIRRYVQTHILPEESHPWIRASRGAPASFDGVAELWWDSIEDFSSRDSAALAAGAELLEDEKRFIDLARSPLFLGLENEVVRPAWGADQPGFSSSLRPSLADRSASKTAGTAT